MIVIGLFGKMGSGKGATSKYLRDRYGFSSLGITDPIKRILKEYMGIPSYKLWGNSEERTEPIRKALQDFGACGRAMQKDIWIKQLILGIEKNRKWSQGEQIVVEDLRYLDEAEELKKRYNATLIMVACPSSYSCVSDPELHKHESEQAVDDAKLIETMDYVLVNDGNLEDLHKKIQVIMEVILNANS